MTATSPTEPVLGASSFRCPHCGAHAQQTTGQLVQQPVTPEGMRDARNTVEHFDGPVTMAQALSNPRLERDHNVWLDGWFVTVCIACSGLALWDGDTLAWPAARRGPEPNGDMPAGVKELYDEARDVANRSPRAAATLLRVALERLVNQLVDGAGSLNDKIGELVQQGLSRKVQQAMDAMRVFGNEGAHAGELDLSDTAQTTDTLFALINVIVQQVVTDTAQVDALYNRIPIEKQAAIARRDGQS